MSRPFVASQTNKIDAKGRVSVPAGIRNLITASGAQSFYAMKSLKDPCLEAFTAERMAAIHRQIAELNVTTDQRRSLQQAYFGGSFEISMDSEGRINLPEALASFAGIDGQVHFVGAGSRFELWNPAAHAARDEAWRAEAARLSEQLPDPDFMPVAVRS